MNSLSKKFVGAAAQEKKKRGISLKSEMLHNWWVTLLLLANRQTLISIFFSPSVKYGKQDPA